METALPSTPPSASPPGSPPLRHDSVDLIRGIAVCGILVMNIVSFGMPAAAYLNPEAYLGERLSSHLVYAFTHVFADQKFMGLFSLLFGSSVMLFINKLKASGVEPLRYYCSRTLWLLLFGLLHGFLLWEGDILFFYAVCGLILYPFRYLPALLQFTLGILVFLSAILIDRSGQLYLESLPAGSLDNLSITWRPTDTDVAYETLVRLSSYREQLSYRSLIPEGYSDHALDVVAAAYVAQGLARAFGLMLVGMAFYSWGVVTAQRSLQFYRRLARVGLAVGLPLSAYGLWQNYMHEWDISHGLFEGLLYNHLATPLVVMGYVGVFMWLQLQGLATPLRGGLSAIGRMAFTNYIGQSLLATFIFYGYGLGLFGQLDRAELFLPVTGIWTFQFFFSLWWLKYFSYGPLEWLWRALTYMTVPPLLKSHHSLN